MIRKRFFQFTEKFCLWKNNRKSKVRTHAGFDLIGKSVTHKNFKRQSKVNFDDKIKDFEKFSFYSFNEESTTFTKPNYVGFCVLEKSNLINFEW